MPENRYHYAALVSTLDEKIGEVLGFVDELGLRENTLVVFISDHGHSTEERTMFGGGSAGPYRGAKFSLFEGGIRVPAIVSLPGRLPRGRIARPVRHLARRAADRGRAAGAYLPAGHKIDGKSLLPILRTRSAFAARALPLAARDQWAVRDGDWKLVVNARDTDRSPVEGDEKIFLSDMAKDPTERRNIASEHPDVVQRLTALHEAWERELPQ